MTFEIRGKDFLRDGKPIKIMSGAVHYFRNMPDTWGDIFAKMRAMGLNCVETYTSWNLHEPKQSEFCFDGILDIAAFIRKAQEYGLMVIIRPGPYICAEWEFGGLPWWLQCDEDMEIRCMNEKYIKCFDRYLDRLFDEIRPLLSTNGGPIIMLQCENEYGYYGDDKEYLKYLRDGYRARGIDVPLFTSDGHNMSEILDGTVEGCLSTLNFGSQVEEKFKSHDVIFPDAPKMCAEMWDGWFDLWGDEHHHTTSVEDYTKTMKDMLLRGSFSIYMFIGGTNFGFTSGASHGEKYMPNVTSYDYDAMLTECGDITPKYMAVREILRAYNSDELPEIPKNREKRAYGSVELCESASLFDNLNNLSTPQDSDVPKTMEKYGTGYGYILYETELRRDYDDITLSFDDIGDRAHVYIEERLVGIVYVNDEELSLKISAKAGEHLYILVENMGRTNFGKKMMKKKGLVGRVTLGDKIHFGWKAYPLEMNNLKKLEFGNKSLQNGFFKGSFDVSTPADTFMRLDNFTKGFVTINGFNIGRFWDIGPQKTLYVPASILKNGKNEIIVFESDVLRGAPTVELTDKPDIG